MGSHRGSYVKQPNGRRAYQLLWYQNPTGHRELLSDWSIYLTTLHIIRYQGWMKGYLRIVWRYQRGNQNPYIEEERTTQWPKEKVQKDKQRSTKHTYKTKERVTRTLLKTGGGERRCSRRVGSSCSTSGTCRVHLVTNPVISREWGKNREVFTTSGTYPWSNMTPYGMS
jgi:hypothetical protein